RQAGHLISRVIRISLFYQNPTCFFSAYFLKHHLNFYNMIRPHSSLNKATPDEFYDQHLLKVMAA
ncbi:hypothetical protein, partial [Acinetobacter geminorum]|uniref:hypothetical protein n=1 Tax=Acinetobacter geminorum TaxID=2730922 RepID=UPI003AF49490